MSTMPVESGREKLVNVVRYVAIAALLVINVVLVGLNLQKHEFFPFGSNSVGEVGGALLVSVEDR